MIRINRATNRINEVEETLAEVRGDLEELVTSLSPEMPDDATDAYWTAFYELTDTVS